MSDDYASDTSTTGSLILGGTSTGNIETNGDYDLFKIFLYAGQQVQFDLKGSATSSGTLTDPSFNFYASGIISSADDNSGAGSNALLTSTASATGYYYANAKGSGYHDKGTYTLQATPLSFNFIKTGAVTINQHTAYIANSTSGLEIKDITAPYSPNATKGYNTRGEAKDVAMVGNLAYVADGSKGLQIIDVSNPNKPASLAGYDTAGDANGVVVSTDNYAYIADGDKGLKVLDVFEPRNPAPGGNYDTTGYAYDIATSGHYAYIADGASGLQVIDVSNPIFPVLVGSYDTEGTAYSVTLNGNYAYIADGDNGLQVIDISTPSSPIRVGGYDTSGKALDVAISNTTAYIADGESGIQVIDISNPIAPAFVKTLMTNDGAANIAIAGNYAYTNTNYSAATQAIRIAPNVLPTGNVTISGNGTQGQTLTAGNTLADADGLGPITYTWQADTKVIGTGDSYKLTSSDAGKAITVTAGYTDLAYTTESITSAATSLVVGNVLPTGTVTITGNAVQGQTLTAYNTLADENGLGTVTYTWTGRTTVLGTGDTYTLTVADVGKTFFVTASYIDGAGTAEKAVSAVTSTVVVTGNHSPTGAVSITGNAVKGQVLTADNTLADVDGLGAISYQWLANDVAINGATASSYTLTGNEIGKTVTVIASYTDGLNKLESVASPGTAAVTEPINHLPTGEVVITGNAVKGQALTVSNTLTDDDGLGAISYQWQANGVNVGTGDSYTLTGNEIGKTVIVNASYIDGLGKTESVSSAATTAVTDAPVIGTAGVSIVGSDFITSEQGDTAVFNVKLNSAPTRDVTIDFTSSDTSEGVITHPTLKFTSTNWSTAQTFTVTGQNDSSVDGDIAYSINAKLTTLDVGYKNAMVNSLTLTNQDTTKTTQVEIINGTNHNDKLQGNSVPNYILGKAGDDDISGAAGNDTLMGSAGNDTLNGGVGNDKLVGSTGNDTLIGDADDDNIDGGDGNDNLQGDAGNDVVNGGRGLDSMSGGMGDDTYWVDNIGDKITEDLSGAGGLDWVNSAIGFSLADKAGVENLILTGGGNTFGTGNSLNNQITGNKGNNTLSGDSGLDTLTGGLGNDTLDGGSGADKLIGGKGSDTYVLNNTEDMVTELFKGGDQDTIKSSISFTLMPHVEVLTLTGSLDIDGTGNTLSNRINGNTGDNTLTGDKGNDTLNGDAGDDILDGGTGNNVLNGGDGNDIALFINNKSDYKLSEDSADGTISVQDIRNGNMSELHDIETINFADSVLDVTNGLPQDLLLSVDGYTNNEGNDAGNSAVFTLTLSEALNHPINVAYNTVDGDAIAGQDYVAGIGSIIFSAGETSKTIDINILGDTQYESDEQFFLHFTPPVDVVMANTEASATLVNDDKPSLSITGTTVSEGNSDKSNADITVTLSTASSQDVTVNYATVNGTALSSSDYTTTVGQLTFAAGETSKNISVPVLGDALIESDETFRVLLSSPTNATIDSTGDGIITIINDDSSSAHIELLGVNLALTNADLVII